MEDLEGTVFVLLPRNKIKTLGSILQNCDELERVDPIKDWKSHNTDDTYSFLDTLSISSIDGIDVE